MQDCQCKGNSTNRCPERNLADSFFAFLWISVDKDFPLTAYTGCLVSGKEILGKSEKHLDDIPDQHLLELIYNPVSDDEVHIDGIPLLLSVGADTVLRFPGSMISGSCKDPNCALLDCSEDSELLHEVFRKLGGDIYSLYLGPNSDRSVLEGVMLVVTIKPIFPNEVLSTSYSPNSGETKFWMTPLRMKDYEGAFPLNENEAKQPCRCRWISGLRNSDSQCPKGKSCPYNHVRVVRTTPSLTRDTARLENELLTIKAERSAMLAIEVDDKLKAAQAIKSLPVDLTKYPKVLFGFTGFSKETAEARK